MNPVSISLRAQNLRKTFNGFLAVEDLSLEIESGEIFGLLGPNGAGKTTSIKMITGLLKPDSGKVEFNLKTINGKNNRFKVGLCPQELVLWNNLTCLEQLVFIAEMYNVKHSTAKDRAKQLLETMGLSEKRNKLVRTLSGGMQRRMNLIMALMHDPEFLILDEPEAGLDPQSRVMVRDFIYSLSKTKTVIFTTHNMDEADRLCHRIAIMDHGKVLVSDSPENLKRILPPTHAVIALNKIFTFGAGLDEIRYELLMLGILTIIYSSIGIWLFKRNHLLKAKGQNPTS